MSPPSEQAVVERPICVVLQASCSFRCLVKHGLSHFSLPDISFYPAVYLYLYIRCIFFLFFYQFCFVHVLDNSWMLA